MSNATAKHYTVGEIAALWGVSRYMVRRIFGNLPGVIKLGNTSTAKKARGYVTLSIPEWCFSPGKKQMALAREGFQSI